MRVGMAVMLLIGLALATDLAPASSQPRVVALLCMMLLGMVASALLFGVLLAPFFLRGARRAIACWHRRAASNEVLLPPRRGSLSD
jgi:hypothetical protein